MLRIGNTDQHNDHVWICVWNEHKIDDDSLLLSSDDTFTCGSSLVKRLWLCSREDRLFYPRRSPGSAFGNCNFQAGQHLMLQKGSCTWFVSNDGKVRRVRQVRMAQSQRNFPAQLVFRHQWTDVKLRLTRVLMVSSAGGMKFFIVEKSESF